MVHVHIQDGKSQTDVEFVFRESVKPETPLPRRRPQQCEFQMKQAAQAIHKTSFSREVSRPRDMGRSES
jgi:hypothetical protein